MTTADAKAAVEKYGSQAAAARALGVGRMTVHDACHGRRHVNGATHAPTAKPGEIHECQPSKGLRGFAVAETTRVAAKKPVATVRARFYSLKKGFYYRLSDAAREWVLSEESIRKHAQDVDCFRYVETSSELWEPCVMHPETAKKYPVK